MGWCTRFHTADRVRVPRRRRIAGFLATHPPGAVIAGLTGASAARELSSGIRASRNDSPGPGAARLAKQQRCHPPIMRPAATTGVTLSATSDSTRDPSPAILPRVSGRRSTGAPSHPARRRRADEHQITDPPSPRVAGSSIAEVLRKNRRRSGRSRWKSSGFWKICRDREGTWPRSASDPSRRHDLRILSGAGPARAGCVRGHATGSNRTSSRTGSVSADPVAAPPRFKQAVRRQTEAAPPDPGNAAPSTPIRLLAGPASFARPRLRTRGTV
jgi:hypothetical protein